MKTRLINTKFSIFIGIIIIIIYCTNLNAIVSQNKLVDNKGLIQINCDKKPN